MVMMPALTSAPLRSIEECRSAGEAFGRDMRGRPRTKFENALVRRLDLLAEEVSAAAFDAEEAVAVFDGAAWTAWEEPLSGPAVDETTKPEGAKAPGRGRNG